MTGRRTALVIVVPAAEPLVAGFRRRHDADAVARRIPPHVTIVFPFAPVETVDDRMVDDLEILYASSPAFDFELTRVGRFEEHVWLAPEPQRCFARLIELTAARFPEWPPYKWAGAATFRLGVP